jgi:N-acetylglucosamine-6-phosphate deacetylase
VRALVERHGLSLNLALEAAIANPAKALGLPVPRIAAGEPANLVVLQGCNVTRVMKNGTWLD